MARIDRSKRAMGTAVKRDKPSQAAQILVGHGLVRGRVLDFGCGFGFDADRFGWESYDPFYRPKEPEGVYDTIICTLVLNALSRNNRCELLGIEQPIVLAPMVSVPRLAAAVSMPARSAC